MRSSASGCLDHDCDISVRHKLSTAKSYPQVRRDRRTAGWIACDAGEFEVGYPTGADAARILAALIRGIPGAQAVDTAAVVAALPERTSGSDIREVVRRAVLAGESGSVCTATLLAEVGSGRYRAEVPGGMYL